MKNSKIKTILFNIIAIVLVVGLYYIFVINKDNDTNLDNNSYVENEIGESQDNEISNDLDSEVLKGEPYYTKDDVALYLHLYKELPPNYLTKSEARDLGWDSSKGNLWEVTDKGVIGGDTFGNREGLLPDGKYFEADVNYNGGFRGAERLVYTSEGKVIYYTGDHYENFELLYE